MNAEAWENARKLGLRKVLRNEDVERLIENNLLLEGRTGGLVLGNSHAKGMHVVGSGVKLFNQSTYDWIYSGEMEGGEYVLNLSASETNREEIAEINSRRDEYLQLQMEIQLTAPNLIVIDCNNDPESKFLRLEAGQAIVNKHSSIIHLDRLNEMNIEGLTDAQRESLGID